MTIPNLTFELIQHCFPKPSENMYIKKMMQRVLEETIRGYRNEFFLMQKYNILLKGSLYANTDSFCFIYLGSFSTCHVILSGVSFY